MFKKIAIGLGVLVALAIGVLLLIALLSSIDSTRPLVDRVLGKLIKGAGLRVN
jgi:hypothetical protein